MLYYFIVGVLERTHLNCFPEFGSIRVNALMVCSLTIVSSSSLDTTNRNLLYLRSVESEYFTEIYHIILLTIPGEAKISLLSPI